MEDKMFT